MGFLRSTEFKIFLTFFIVYSLFIHWVGWYEDSRIALTESICREGRLEIDSYANFTGDRAKYNGHYYSDRAPGISLLAVPICLISDSIFGYTPPHSENNMIATQHLNTTLYSYIDMPMNESMIRILSVIFLSSLPGALLLVLIYKISNFYIKQEFYRMLITFSFGFGTLIFPYSSVILGSILGSFLGLLAFYIILKTVKKSLKEKYIFISGVLLGFSMVVEYFMITVFIGMILFIFLSKKIRKYSIYFLIGACIGILPLILYNLAIFSNPFQLTTFYVDSPAPQGSFIPTMSTFPRLDKIKWIIKNFIYLPIRSISYLFLPYRGLFFYTPFLLFSIFGFYYLYKEDKILTKVLLLIFLLFLMLTNLNPYWFGGSSFGLRYSIYIVPLLSIPLAVFLERFCKQNYLKIILFILLFLSVFHNLLAFSAPWEGAEYVYAEGVQITTEINWSGKISKMNAEYIGLLNPLYDFYLPNFIKDGSRSRIFESLLYNPIKIDIRSSNPMPIKEIKLFTTSIGIVILKIPFLIIPILLLVITLIWRKELSRILVFKKMTLLSVLVVLIALLFVSRFEFKNLVYVFKIGNPEQSWYEPLETEDLRWMQQNAKISLFNPNKSQERRLFFYIRSFNKDRNFTVFINGNLVDNLIALKEGGFVHTSTFDFVKGENLIEFYSEEDCDIPHFVIDSDDARCLSVGIKNLSLKFVEKDEFIFGHNWYDGGEKWMKNDGTILFYNSDDNIRKIKLYIDAQGYINDWPISMFLNDGLADRFTVFKERSKIHTSMITLEPGENILRFHSDEGCKITNENVNSSDKRCLSIIIKSITVVTMNELISENKMLNFGYNWYDSEEIDSVRWMNQDGTIHLINFDNNSKEVKFYSYLKSYYEDRKINIYLNNQLIDSLIAFKEGSEVYTPMITLGPGENILRFHSDEGCKLISEIGKSNDNRCISVGVKDVSLLSRNEIKESGLKYIFNKNWYDQAQNENERWMNNNATISLFYFDSPYESAIFNFDFFPYFKERTVSFYLNEELKNVFDIDKDGGWVYTAPLLLKSGENVLRFYSEEGCTVIDDVEKNDDYRCVSLSMKNITLS